MSQLDDLTQDELQLLGQEVKNVFSLSYLELLARETGMIQRKRKCRSQDLVSLCVFLSQTVGTESLVSLCSKLHERTGLSLSAEGLNQRFNSRSAEFFKRLFTHLFHRKICPTSSLSTPFKRIRILDSTMFQLPPHYAGTYKGFGGGASQAGVKIQLEYDLLSGEFLQLDVDHAVSSDNVYGQARTQALLPGDLAIRDMGYFYMDDLERINQKGAFYISRIRWNTQIYQKNEGNWELLAIEKMAKDLKSGQTMELPEVYIGFHQKHKTRLIVYKLTEKEWKKRLEHHKKQKKKIPKYASQLHLLVSNITSEMVPTVNVYRWYSLRWQIEILFKTWKSIFSIHAVKPIKLERFQCHLYGQLIGLCLAAGITYRMRKLL